VVETPLVRLEGEQRIRGRAAPCGTTGSRETSPTRRTAGTCATRPGGGSWVMLTGGSDHRRAGRITRALMDRDPWLMAGFAGSWKIVWLRNLLRGM
jgi:hypothetical protein